MGKNHRHAKKLKSERNKVQIKTKTKFLPKGQNVTNTAFKVKPIVLQEQLKERATSTPASKKKANIEELISRLKHFNDAVKAESCQDLKETISTNLVEIFQVYLSAILQNGAILVQDRERKVRRGAVKLLQAIFNKVSTDALRPFFTYILTNLKCAMTNINKHIQEDSLLLIDAVLEHQSALLTETFDDFFPNFLLLISKLRNQSAEHTLSLNLEGKVTSVKWRVKVLTRLYGILKALDVEHESLSQQNLYLHVEAKGSSFIPLYRDISLYENLDSILFSQTKKTGSEFEGYMPQLTKLLYEIFLEVLPEKKSQVKTTTILTNEDAVAIFTCVVHILSLLRDKGVACEGILESLVESFPYSHNKTNLEATKDFPKCFQWIPDQNCLSENLMIVYMYIEAGKGAKNEPQYKNFGTYINNYLSRPRLHLPSLPLLLRILKLLLERPPLCRKLQLKELTIIDTLSQLYASSSLSEKCRLDVLDLLMNSRHQNSSFVANIPNFLVQKRPSEKLIEGVLVLCRQDYTEVQEGVKKSLSRILEVLPEMDVGDDGLKNLASILFYLPLSPEDVEEVRNFVNCHSELAVSKFLRNVLELRCYILRK